MPEILPPTRFYLLAAIFMLVQTGIAFLVNPIIGGVSLLITGFIFLGAIFAHRETEGVIYDKYTQTRVVGSFPSGGCGIMLGPVTVIAILITFVVNIPGGSFDNFLYVIPAIIAAILTLYAGFLVFKAWIKENQ